MEDLHLFLLVFQFFLTLLASPIRKATSISHNRSSNLPPASLVYLHSSFSRYFRLWRSQLSHKIRQSSKWLSQSLGIFSPD